MKVVQMMATRMWIRNQDLKIIKPVLSKYGINEKPVFPNLILPMVMKMETQKMN